MTRAVKPRTSMKMPVLPSVLARSVGTSFTQPAALTSTPESPDSVVQKQSTSLPIKQDIPDTPSSVNGVKTLSVRSKKLVETPTGETIVPSSSISLSLE